VHLQGVSCRLTPKFNKKRAIGLTYTPKIIGGAHMKYMGIDHHKQYLIADTMDKKGARIRKDRVSTDRQSMRSYINQMNREGDLSVVIEASYGWEYIYDEIKDLVEEIKVAHPLKTKAIAEARIKTDSIDAATLAHLLRSDLIPEAYAPRFETRDKKYLFRYRSSLVKIRTMLKNMAHAILSRNHVEEPEFRRLRDKFGKKGKAYMRSCKLKGNDTRILHEYLDVIEYLEGKILNAERKIKETYQKDEICQLLESVPGIGELSAVLIRYEIDDIERFVSSSKLCSYAGLVPSTYSSGGRTYQGRITKQGNKWLRWTLIEAAQSAITKDHWLRKTYERIEKRGGKKKAKLTIARKLLEIIYRIWKEKRPYYEKSSAVALVSL
jgi:transposase